MSIVYDIFSGNSSGGPVDYTTVITTVSALTVALAALPLSSTTIFAVRARDTVSGLSDQNTDAQVTIVVSATGADATNAPSPPQALAVRPGVNGAAILTWSYPFINPVTLPTGFHVYQGTPSTPSYGAPVATVLYSAPAIGRHGFVATITGLTDGTVYAFGVRAYNASGEETNAVVALVTADATAPANIPSLTATLT